MTSAPTAFHEGELAVQKRAGVRLDADRLAPMMRQPSLDGGASTFLARQSLIVVSARDITGVFWASLLVGGPGFLDAQDTTLRVAIPFTDDDPLAGLPVNQPVGMLAIDLSTRRRMRVNGQLVSATGGLQVAVDQAYGNCPKYITPRELGLVGVHPASAHATRRQDALNRQQIETIRQADTFFFGTVHPERGTDVSHRGGPPGVVRVDGESLWWPDYPGNNMFNSFGNLEVDDTASLVFPDFTTGTRLHLSGSAVVEWTTPGAPGDDGGTGRRVRFTPRYVVETNVA